MKNRFDIFVYLISSLNRYIRKIKTEELVKYDLKGTQLMCLYYLGKLDKITAIELGHLTGEDKSAISRALEFLESAELIKNEDEEGKKYKTFYVLTEKGEEVATCLGRKIDETIAGAGSGLTDEEREIMYRSLEIINNNLKEICKKY